MTRFSPDQWTGRLPVLLRGALTALVLAGLLLAMVEARARILRDGTEVRLATAPVDPRDLFRGDYVVLAYGVSTLDPAALDGDDAFRRDEAIFVTVTPGPDGLSVARAIHRTRPATRPAGATMLRGRVASNASCPLDVATGETDCRQPRTLRVAYGIESYFVPQGTGRGIERTERSRIEVVAAVSASGEMAIKRLLIDGKRVHDEPPY